MSLKKRFEKLFWLEEEEAVEETKQVKQQPIVKDEPRRPVGKRHAAVEQQAATVVSLQSVQKSSKVILVEPRAYAEAQDISEHLKNKRAVIVNLQRIERDQGFRIVDFLSGTVYALGGDIQRVGTDIFLCTPENVEVAGSITEYLTDRN